MLTVRRLTRPGILPADLDVDAGECVALVGPSGSGKTLLLRAIADLDEAQGAVSLDGRGRETMPGHAWRRLVRYLSAESGWWADTVGDHFADPQRASAEARRLGLDSDVMTWPVARLSTGERQRLALVRALEDGPPVLLLDEPTSGLDGAAAQRVEAVIAERCRAGAAVVVVTHDPAQAARLAVRTLHIDGGNLAPAGPGDSAP